METAVSSDALQARYFMVELEGIADILVQQIDALDKLQGGKPQAHIRRNELYEVRRQIDAIRIRFDGQL